jgi:hypothetical protein
LWESHGTQCCSDGLVLQTFLRWLATRLPQASRFLFPPVICTCLSSHVHPYPHGPPSSTPRLISHTPPSSAKTDRDRHPKHSTKHELLVVPLMSLRLCLWLVGLVLAAAQCTCAKPAGFQGHIKESPVVFVGTARLQGNEVKGSVMRPIKGCLEFGTTMTLMTNPDCPIAAPPLDTVALFTGRQYTYDDGTFAVVLDSCGLQKALVDIPTADITWMNKQFEVCEGETKCPSGASHTHIHTHMYTHSHTHTHTHTHTHNFYS